MKLLEVSVLMNLGKVTCFFFLFKLYCIVLNLGT